MKKALLIVLGVVVVAILGVLAAASMQPDQLKVERSVTVAATPADVFPYANDFDKWQQWNPWREMDPSQKETFSENRAGVGAWYAWEGNDDVGQGRMTITQAVQDQSVSHDLHFIEPFESKAVVTFTLTPVGEQTEVTWGFVSEQDLMGKAFGLFADMDTMLGADFQRGLDKLRPLAEAHATERVAAARAAAEAAAAAAAAAAVPLEGALALDGAALP